MMHYSIEPKDQIFAKSYGFLSLAKSTGKNLGKNISKNLSGKNSQKRLYHAKKSAADAIKIASKNAIQKTADTIQLFIKLLIKSQMPKKVYLK